MKMSSQTTTPFRVTILLFISALSLLLTLNLASASPRDSDSGSILSSLTGGVDAESLYAEWIFANELITDGPMVIHRVPGQVLGGSSVEVEQESGLIRATGYFKGGVIVYDSGAQQSYVAFHPRDMYSWPTHLEISGDFLVIGTRGEGIAIVNLKTDWLYRFPHAADQGPFPGEVESLEIQNGKVLVNGFEQVDLSTLKN